MDGLAEKEVLEEAKRGKDVHKIRKLLCEAYYYLGEERLWNGNRKGAKEYFQKSVETNIYNFIGYQATKAKLENMKKNEAMSN
jgi:lipoprotein NlpI